MRISKYKSIFEKSYIPNWSKEVFVIKKVKDTVLWTYLIKDLNGEEIIGFFYKRELQIKNNKKEFCIEKRIKRKDNKLCVKWEGCGNSFISGIDKKVLSYKMSYFSEPYTKKKTK